MGIKCRTMAISKNNSTISFWHVKSKPMHSWHKSCTAVPMHYTRVPSLLCNVCQIENFRARSPARIRCIFLACNLSWCTKVNCSVLRIFLSTQNATHFPVTFSGAYNDKCIISIIILFWILYFLGPQTGDHEVRRSLGTWGIPTRRNHWHCLAV